MVMPRAVAPPSAERADKGLTMRRNADGRGHFLFGRNRIARVDRDLADASDVTLRQALPRDIAVQLPHRRALHVESSSVSTNTGATSVFAVVVAASSRGTPAGLPTPRNRMPS